MDTTEEIKSRLDIVDLVADYLTLKTAGSGAFKACCPFHQEKTPSFYVSRNRQSWHCFGCDQGGDHFTFVEKMEGMEFREALEFLAQKTGVELPKFDGEKMTRKKRLVEVNDLATKYFRSALANLPQAEQARAYLDRRGVDGLTRDLFKLGYAPDSWSALVDALAKKGVTSDEMLEAGLVGRSDRGGVYDRFRDRLMFPIADVHGNIVGFTGRILHDEKKEAKYMNTPETALYRKSAVLYGLEKAKGEIRQQDLAVIVEGNMDVLSSHQFGVSNVVASSGTALTVEQLGLLRRFSNNLAIAFDQDAAGTAATVRGLDLARAQDFSIKIITLPPEGGKDPDEAVHKDPQIWKDAIKNAVGIMEWIYRQAFKNRRTDLPEDKKEIAKDVLPEIRRIADPIERDHWIKKLSHDLGASEAALIEAMGRRFGPGTGQPARPFADPSRTPPAQPPRPGNQDHEREKRIFAALLAKEEGFLFAMNELGLRPADFFDPELGGLYESLCAAYHDVHSLESPPRFSAGGTVRLPPALSESQTKIFNTLAILAEREFEEGGIEAIKDELRKGLEVLRSQHGARERRLLEEEMRMAERQGDTARIAELMKRFADLQ